MASEVTLPEGWQTLKLGDLGKIVTGKTPSTKVADNFGDDVPFITPSDMDGRRIIVKTARGLTYKGAETVASAQIPAGAVMVSCIGSDMGKTAIAGCDAVTNQQINSIIVDDAYSSLFVYYNMNLRKAELQHLASGGSAQPILNKGHFAELPILMPPLIQQEAIACILGVLDDKIELNKQMNGTLEAMAWAIFKSWFVDFDPVSAKAEGRDPGLPKKTADLFPDGFEESPLGSIPGGWSASSVGTGFQLTMGQSPPGSTYNETEDGIPFYQGCRDFGFRFPSRRVFCTAPTRFAEPGDTLVSVRAPVGDINMASERCSVGRGVAAIRHRSGSRSFTYYSMRNLRNHFRRFEAEGTVFGCINKADFEGLAFVAPTTEVLNAFDRVVTSLDDRIEWNEQQSSTLAGLRDVLLPKLLSGDVQLENAEQIVGRSA